MEHARAQLRLRRHQMVAPIECDGFLWIVEYVLLGDDRVDALRTGWC